MSALSYIEKARQGRRIALASLETRISGSENVVSIFDFATERRTERRSSAANVVAFHSCRSAEALAA